MSELRRAVPCTIGAKGRPRYGVRACEPKEPYSEESRELTKTR